jgi:hypothetical protein
MTLHSDKNNRGNKRPGMSRRTTIIVVVIALAVIAYAASQVILSGQSFF